jgi:hypothetical protein
MPVSALELSPVPLCGFFNDTASNPNCVALNDGMVVNNELERMWKEAVIA